MRDKNSLTKPIPSDPTEHLFARADLQWEAGHLRAAFRTFLAAAKAGNKAAQLNVGYFYDLGIGVRPDPNAALHWYKKAYKRGSAEAASNIGTVRRDQGQIQRALSWFKKAVAMGDDDANLQIAKIYLALREYETAMPYLNRILGSNTVTEANLEQAKLLLRAAGHKG
jgi:TPR repeat protein